VKVGVMDFFSTTENSTAAREARIRAYAPLQDKMDFFGEHLDIFQTTENQTHGIYVSTTLLGSPVGSFKGGVAPDARLYAMNGYDTLSLYEKGVRLFNSSTGLAISQRERDAGDCLYVVAGENESSSNMGGLGLMPLSDHRLRENMIVVGALHAVPPEWRYPDTILLDGSNPGYSIYNTGYSNACGPSAMWCVTAVANLEVPSELNPEELGSVFGTSFAAPAVSGVAALVWEAYPWMSASNVQKTILTTASDIGEPGIDPIYGWGLVNARKAIDGPAQFFKNEDTGTRKYYLWELNREIERFESTEITEQEYLEKYAHLVVIDYERDGNDKIQARPDVHIRIIQSAPYSGEQMFIANVDAMLESRPFFNDTSGNGGLRKRGMGSLTLAGQNTYSGGTLIEGGILHLTGSLTSDVTVVYGGTFFGDRGIINANYFPKTRSRTTIRLGEPLTVTGTVDIEEGALLQLFPPRPEYTVQSRETLINAGAVHGKFDPNVMTNGGFFWNVVLGYTNETVHADLTRASAQAQAMSLNAPTQVINGARIADTLIGYTDGLVQSGRTSGHEALLSATAKLMSAPTDEAAALSLSTLTGEIHTAARALGVQRALGDGERLADRLRGLGTASGTGVWLQNGAGNGHLTRMGYGEAEVHHSAFGIGLDERFGEAWTLGLSATRTRSNAHLDALGGRLNGSGQQMAVYARRDVGSNGYLSALASHERHMVDTQRRVLTGDTFNTVIGQHTDNAALVRLESGLRLKGGLTPYLATGALSLRQGSFTESGVLGLSAGADTFSTAFVELGTRFDRHIGRWTFAGTASARRMSGGEGGFNAAFAGAEAARVNVTGQPLARSSVRLGSDVGYRTRNGWQISLGLGADQGS